MWPGTIPARQVNSNLVDFSDVLPTLLDVAGVKTPADTEFDGYSLLPQLRGGKESPREWVYVWFYRRPDVVEPEKAEVERVCAFDLQYKFYSGGPRKGKLFDCRADPMEMNPISDEQMHAEQKIARAKLSRAITLKQRPGFLRAT